jgi:predicted ATPase/DNA-binding SARP family transcriptional activator
VRATRESWSVTRFRTQKAEALLGYLAVHRDHAQPREVVAEILWPGSEPAHARNNLSRELSSLRQQLEPPGVPAGSVVLARRATIQLDPEAVETDVAELEAALALGPEAGSDRVPALAKALALYRGELLPGHYEDWIEPVRRRLERRLLEGARELATALEAQGDLAGAIAALRRAVEIDPLGEEAHRELMAALVRAGESAKALEVYAHVSGRLERELGASPSTATAALASSIDVRPSPGLTAVLAFVSSHPLSNRDREDMVAELRRHEGRVVAAPDAVLLGAFARLADAAACAALVVRRRPTLRAALDVAEGDTSPRGAQALAAIAAPGTLLASERASPLLGLDLGVELALSDLGRYEVAGTEERVFRVDGPGLSTAEPAARRATSASFPLEVTRFFGREAQRSEIRELLGPGGSRLVTVIGPGGVGKTRLAIEVLRDLEAAYAGEAWFVALAAVNDASLVLDAIARALRLPVQGSNRLESIERALERRSGLIVLDNLEQLGDAAAHVVASLLERVPRASCLVTSRRRLGIAGERLIELEPLPLPTAMGSLEELERAPSVQMFADRARAVRPGFAVDAQNAAATRELVRRLEGLPLALALAAGRAHVLSPEQILARLGPRFALLESRSAVVPERHRTLRAALEWSTDLLPEPLRLAFARLSVLRGAFTLEAAEAVTEDPLALDALSELRECSLLQGSEGGDGPRFRFLETIRELADERLDPVERPELERRHATHFAARAAEAEPRLHGPEGSAWFKRVAADYPNMRAVLERGARAPSLAPIALGLARALRSFWFGSGPTRDVAALLPPLLEASTARTPDRAAVLWALGLYRARYERVETALPALEESLAIWREVGNAAMATGVVFTLAETLSRAGEDAAARARFEEGLALARASGDVRRLGWGLGAFAQHLFFQDDLDRARSLVEESIAIHEPIDVPQHALEEWRLGQILQALGDQSAAEALATRALETLRRLDFGNGVAQCQALLGRSRAAAGDATAARTLLLDALAGFRKGDRPDYIAQTLLDLAGVAIATRDLAAGRAHLDECSRLVRDTCEHLFRHRILVLEGELARAEGDLARARSSYLACLEELETRRGWSRGSSLSAARAGLASLTPE